MKSRYSSLNINMLWPDKNALKEYARAQGENISVIVRRLIKDELIRKGFLDIEKQKTNEISKPII